MGGVWLLALVLGCAAAAHGQGGFRVRFDAGVRPAPASGRLVIYLKKSGSHAEGGEPADGPFFDDPQPMYGLDVKGLKPGEWMVVNDGTLAGTKENEGARPRVFPVPLSRLAPGPYQVQAVLDMKRENSSWRREVGNLYSDVISMNVDPGQARNRPVDIVLSSEVAERGTAAKRAGVEFLEVRSELLSRFRGGDVMLRAGVVLPENYDAARPGGYPAVYEVPGFGGDHEGAIAHARHRGRTDGTDPVSVLNRSAFWIVLDPEGPNGHHLFANSANNGPVGDALVKELIPALENKYNVSRAPAGRLLRGHSSGGWSTLWLATEYPETFGAAWSTSPDPVDFRKFQSINIYRGPNAYTSGGSEVPSYRRAGSVRMTVRQENAMEEVLGPDNTSGQQWDSWFAVFGPRTERGTPAAAWDAASGAIDHVVTEQYKAYDIADRLRRDAAKYGPIFKQRVRIIVGDEDNYYLNEAVALLEDEVNALNFLTLPEGSHGSITIVPGRDHGSIFMTPQMQSIPREMVEHLRRAGYVN